MSESKSCINCGGTTFGEGELRNEARAMPKTNWNGGSVVLLTICTNCGEVNSMRVEHPERFIDKKKF